MKVSIVVPVYNEQRVIGSCLKSLWRQDYQDLEVIVVDDGSKDRTLEKVQDIRDKIQEGQKGGRQGKNLAVRVFKKTHQGPGAARNLGARYAKGEILVFVDADMKFARDFISKLVAPILAGKAIGTFSCEEYLLNRDRSLARCWNLNLGSQTIKMEPRDFGVAKSHFYQAGKSLLEKLEGRRVEIDFTKRTSHVFRAILRGKFLGVGGFDTNLGYTDDWSLSRKLGVTSVDSPGAKFYHRNPQTLGEVWVQARWFGKNEFLTKNFVRKIYNLFRYCPLFSILKGAIAAVGFREPAFFPFKVVYDTAVFTSVLLAFFKERKDK